MIPVTAIQASAEIESVVFAYTITNPYANVNWSTVNQYKAALHVHSTISDGSDTVADMAEAHYERGFHIVGFTDHNYTMSCPTQTPSTPDGPKTPLSTARLNEMLAGTGRTGGANNGMIFVPNGNERDSQLPSTFPSRAHHVSTFWSNIDNHTSPTSEPIAAMLGRLANEGTGNARLNHIGRNTGASFTDSSNRPERHTKDFSVARQRNNNPDFVTFYTDLFRNNPRLIGMEIINEFDNESQASDIMWDNILTQLTPQNRNIWAFADDDSHTVRNVGWSYNIMLMQELTLPSFRSSMENGAFFAFSRVNRKYDVFPGPITPEDTRGSTANFSRISPVLDYDVPEITSITTNSNSITINTRQNNLTTYWYSNGVRIAQGATLNLSSIPSASLGSYVRATVRHPSMGVLYTQPFRIQTTALHTITFNPGTGGTVNPASAVAGIDNRLSSLPTPARGGHTFNGWFTSATGGTAVTTSTVFNSSTTIHAQWTPITVTFNPQSGVVTPASATVGTNNRLSALPTPTRAGFVFNGWFTSASGGTAITASTEFPANTTIHAQWSAITVTFNPQSGTVTPTSSAVNSNLRLTSLPIPSRTNFAFNGWFTSASGGTAITLDRAYETHTTIHAQWSQIRTVTFNAQGGTVTPASAQTGANGRLTLSALPTPSRAGFNFIGWFTEANGGTAVTLDRQYDANTAIHAQWSTEPVIITVTFNPNGSGATVNPTSAVAGTNGTIASLPTPTRSGFAFNGWFTAETGGTAVTTSTVFNSSTAIHAQWSQIRTVTFNPQGGSVSPTSAQTGVNGRLTLSALPTPARSGHTFTGWFTEATGGTAITTDRQYNANTTIHAQWTAITHTIIFNPQGGTVNPASGVTNAQNQLTSLPAPARTGFTFDGWFTAATGGALVTTNTVFNSNSTIHARWTAITVTFNPNGSGASVNPSSASVNSYARLASLPTPTRAGFVFAGWFTAETGGVSVTTDTIFSENSTIFAQWTLSAFTITFNPQGGAVNPATASTNTEGRLSSLPTPTRPGFAFGGWFTEETGGTAVTADTVFSENKTIFARWTAVTVTFNPNNGTVTPVSATVNTNGRLTSLPVPTRPGFAFSGWFSSIEDSEETKEITAETVFSENTVIYARWSIITVTFNAQEGTVTPLSAAVGNNNRLSALPTPTREGFSFNGWFTAEANGTAVTADTVFNENTTIFAQWSQIFTVTFNPNGSGASVNPTTAQTVENGRLATLPTPVRSGFFFSGWFTAEAGGAQITAEHQFTANTTLFAHWSNTAAVVTFNPNGGILGTGVPPSATVGANGRLTSLPVPTREGYYFNGWFTSAASGIEITAETVFSGDTTIVAQWSQIRTVTFNPQGGAVNPTSAATGANGRLSLTALPIPTRSGYTFNGWFTEISGGTAIALNRIYDADTTVFAQWTAITHTITFNPNNGTVIPASSETNAYGILPGLPIPVRIGYTFTGWFTQPAGGTAITAATVFNQAATIHAQWSVKLHTVTLDPQDGAVTPTSLQANANGRLSTLPNPTKAGHIFNGWFTAAIGGVAVTTETVFSSDFTIFARWTPFMIIFSVGSGTVNPSNAVVNSSGQLSSLPTPTRNGFTFGGWFTENTGGTAVTTATVFDSNTIIFARWTANQPDPCTCTQSSCAECNPPCLPNCSCEKCKPAVRKGDVDGNGYVTIADALEILKYLASIHGILSNDTTGASMEAARITVEAPEDPKIGCVLEILKYLAGIPSMID
jgi:uncharacterized repeat protein (TIGR02543 family)